MHPSLAPLTPTQGYHEFAAEYAAFATTVRGETLPGDVMEAARANLLDTLACATAGRTAPGVADVVAFAAELGGASFGQPVRRAAGGPWGRRTPWG